jgi:hypothetical protein
MMQRRRRVVERNLRNAILWIRRKVKLPSHCRQCGERSSWWDDVCRACGTADPVRLPKQWLVYAATILVVLGMTMLA